MDIFKKPAELLENLLKSIENYIKEDAKHAAGVTCLASPFSAAVSTQSLYDRFLAGSESTKSHIYEAYLEWINAIGRINKLICNADLTPQERTVLILKHICGKSNHEIMEDTGYTDVDTLISRAETKVTIVNM